MTVLSEAIGMMPRGTSSLPANDARRRIAAENAGRRIVGMVRENLTPEIILTRESFENAIRVCMALGGSTNAILHLIAIAGRRGIRLPLLLFDEISAETPVLANVKLSGAGLMVDFDDAGGLPALMKRLESKLNLNCLTCSGETLGAQMANARCFDDEIIRPMDRLSQNSERLQWFQGILRLDAPSSRPALHPRNCWCTQVRRWCLKGIRICSTGSIHLILM